MILVTAIGNDNVKKNMTCLAPSLQFYRTVRQEEIHICLSDFCTHLAKVIHEEGTQKTFLPRTYN